MYRMNRPQWKIFYICPVHTIYMVQWCAKKHSTAYIAWTSPKAFTKKKSSLTSDLSGRSSCRRTSQESGLLQILRFWARWFPWRQSWPHTHLWDSVGRRARSKLILFVFLVDFIFLFLSVFAVYFLFFFIIKIYIYIFPPLHMFMSLLNYCDYLLFFLFPCIFFNTLECPFLCLLVLLACLSLFPLPLQAGRGWTDPVRRCAK